ncbi:MAG: DEAD/DEAH box helicase [Sphingobacteriales bacterium]|uniref:type I restriction endonuclease subunit R n=1 Tax=Hydrotalea flava TaxID=714549 RepID=UPI00082B2817|nr:DEAD/DEAH box helicase family protein [Hydrotalea flava]RTL48801.1 MAG: DEAD/DEAH box helicase [Sphingobacteriales bacterium]
MNQDPEQIARDNIDKQLIACGWVIQDKDKINLNAALGVVVRYYLTQDGKETDYVLFIDKKPVGVIEAKREEEGHRLTTVEEQSNEYANSKLKYLNNDPLPFVYESTGDVTRFTDFRDPKPRSRPVFTFHRPETFRTWLKTEKSLRASLLDIPVLQTEGLRDCQINAITKLESSFKEFKPKALIQMATGSGKTFTAISFIYRLLKFTEAKRILFLVDTKNLGEQAEQEFMSFLPNDDNRKFTELYGVHRLKSSYVPTDNHVYISTIQRLYSILKGTELEESAEEENPNERWQPKEPMPVVYNEKLPIEFFDFIVIDECHRSIYNLWMQVLQYYDAFQIGLTATPDNRTFGYFNQNIVSEYTHEQAIADGVNVGFDVFLIETQITQQGGTIWKGEYVERREKLSRKKRWELQDENENYTANQLDKDIVNPNQIRLIIKTFKEHLPEIFPDRFTDKGEFEIPKTLIFAKTDSHADDIINIVREEFGEGNSFCKKITYRNKDEDPKSVLAQFRNDYFPRIAVTVDMIATGTDVKPLECLLFMRDVRSRNYFEQMKGRGTRIITLDDLRKVTPTAKHTKDHFVIVDAVGVTKSIKSDSRPLEKKPGVPLKDLLGAIAVGNRDEELFSSLANRLTRLEKQITEQEKQQFSEKAEGKTLKQVVNELLQAYNPDVLDDLKAKVETEMAGESPMAKEKALNKLHDELKEKAANVFHSSDLREYIDNVRRAHEQTIDITNPDTLLNKGWATDSKEKAENLVADFKTWIALHQDEITALQIFYTQPYRRRELNYKMIQEVLDKLKLERPLLAPMQVWRAYEQLEKATGSPKSELIALVSLLRRISGIDSTLIDYSNKVDLNFRDWILKKNAGQHNRFTEEQMQWLRMIKDHIATSIHLDADDLDYTPFDAKGGKGKMWQLFGEQMDEIIIELNEALAA